MMDEKKVKDKFHFFNHLNKAYLIIVIVVMLVFSACALFVTSFRLQLYEQRSYSLSQTAEKIVQITDTVIDNELERLTFISYELSAEPQSTSEELLARLEQFYTLNLLKHKLKVSCIDSNGNTYQWDGKIGRWTLPAMLLPNQPTYQVTIIDNVESASEQMVFIYTLPERIKLESENIELTHTILYLDMKTFGSDLEVSSFNGNSFSYITEQNGIKLYHQQNQNEFISAYNILAALKQTKFLYGESYESFTKAMKENNTCAAEIVYEGKNYFVSCSTLSVNDWILFIFVPEASIGDTTANLMKNMLLYVCIIAILIILMISGFVWTNSRQTLIKQQLAVEEARKASDAKSNFLSHMSHDIRTPLNGIMGMCHIAEVKKNDKKSVSECLEKIDLSSRQLMALINDCLDMSRIEQGKIEINHAPVDIMDLLKTCTIHTEAMISEKGIIFKQTTTGIIHKVVSADEVVMEKILTNILGNAAKFTESGGKICLIAKETPIDSTSSMYQFKISDTGIGMSLEFIDHLFEPFSQEHMGSRTKYQGTGLGLAIVKNLVDRLGGTIEVESAIKKGSTFTISIPLHHLDEKEYSLKKQIMKPFDGTGYKALLVEDNELNCIIAKAILEECGLTVDTAENGAIALEIFQNSPAKTYDVILMDVRMPIMDGLEASKRIRTSEKEDATTIPIIALSADAFREDTEKTHQAGMNDHLSKPIDIEKLHAILRKYCSKEEM